MYDLSILIPARNEMFLTKTIEDILANIEGNTEIIVILDGAWADPPITQHPRVTVVYHTASVGQRAATNEAAKLSTAKYLMKVDAHCSFDKGFDVKMMADMQDDWTMIPLMKNLHVFDWLCPDGHRRYQGPSGPCTECQKPTVRDVVWIAKDSPNSTAYRFDTNMHFQYWNEWKNTHSGDLTETMSIQGSCFMCTRKKYFELDICSEDFSSWGQQGVEVACKTWLSGGKVMVNHKTWYAHMFRTQGGDFSFPYEQRGSKVKENREKSKDLFVNNKWPKAIHKFQWLLDKFHPPDWESKLKGIVFYTDNQLNLRIAHAVQRRLKTIGLPIVSVSLKPMTFGTNICLPLARGYLAMFKQILAGLEASTAEIVFLCEHDVLYHPTHFNFVPPRKDRFYYNENFWKLRVEDGHALHYDAKQVSGLCAYRALLIDEYKKRVAIVERDGYSRSTGFEPGTHDGKAQAWKSEWPIVDIRHDHNLTKNRWTIDEFRDKSTASNWIEAEEVPGWGKITLDK